MIAYVLDITHGSSVKSQHWLQRRNEGHLPKLNDANIRLLVRAIDRDPGYTLDPLLDSVDDMRYNLHRDTKVSSSPLLLEDFGVDLAGGDVVIAS